MYNPMPPTNSRKRAAPGASPTPQMTQTYPPAASAMQTPEYLRGWAPGVENSNGNSNGNSNSNSNAGFADPSAAYNMNAYNGNNLAQVPNLSFDQASSAQLASTQLARRPVVNRQMVSTAPKYENGVETWGQYVDDSMGDPLLVNGPLEESDNIELLEERAAVAKRDAQSKRKQIPPFVQKLSSFLEESRNTELIRWSDRGDSFVVLDEDEFAKTLIPELFKHNNYASFVRQLNMYGFHKRVGLSDNSMKASERKNKSPSEYYNPYFKRGHPNLLWLINKPKGGATKGTKKARPKDENQERDSDEDGQDIEEVYGNNVPRALSAAPEPGSLQRRDVAVIQNQLMEIQKQQGAITNAISRLRKDHNQLYQQSMAFQTLHDRHENSINAILTFLATVYNRSLDGQGAQNIAQMFQNGIPPEQQQGSVVDVTGQQEPPHPGSLSPHRRQQRLLMAPPGEGRTRVLESPTPVSTPQPQTYQNQHATIEELFDSPLDSPVPTPEPSNTNSSSHTRTHSQQPQNMMNIINSTNAQTRPNPHNIQFPDMLSHYENAHNRTSLTENERNSLLTNIMNVTSPSNTSTAGERVDSRNNALISPSPPQQPTFHDLNLTQGEIDELVRLQKEQDSRIESIRGIVEPLSPSGSIPGLDANGNGNGGGGVGSDGGGGYFNAADFGDHHLGFGEADMDMEQFLDGDAFYGGGNGSGNGIGGGGGNSSPGVDFGGGFDGFGGNSGNGGFDELGLGDDGVGGDTGMEGDLSGGGIGGSGGGGGGNAEGLGRSPSKRRRKN